MAYFSQQSAIIRVKFKEAYGWKRIFRPEKRFMVETAEKSGYYGKK